MTLPKEGVLYNKSKTALISCPGKKVEVAISTGVTSIRDRAFEGCESLESVEIPDSVTSIGGSAFYNCSSLASVTIGCSVASIGTLTFEGCSSMESATIGNSVTSIGAYAFYDYRKLTSVTLPVSVVSISSGAFMSCYLLATIYYGGSADDWQNIWFGDSNSYLINATRYYYSETMPSLEGIAEENYVSYLHGFWHYVNENKSHWDE